jgi:hypothetical protein
MFEEEVWAKREVFFKTTEITEDTEKGVLDKGVWHWRDAIVVPQVALSVRL